MNPWLHVFHPAVLARKWLRSEPNWSLQTKLDLDWFAFPDYAYGLNRAAIQAKRLGLDAIAAVEVGVGDGAGLVALEAIAAELAREHGLAIHTYGLDAVERPPSTDPRDLPYARPAEPTRVDRAALDAKLKSSTLILGDLGALVPRFFDDHDPPPLGFVAFALGDYTTTARALALFDAPPSTRLPRTFVSFANVVGDDDVPHCAFAGELLAIGKFNESHDTLKLGAIHGLRHKRIFHAAWCEQMYVLHDFTHPRYGEPPGPDAAREATPLDDAPST